jgi:hypothetical protein
MSASLSLDGIECPGTNRWNPPFLHSARASVNPKAGGDLITPVLRQHFPGFSEALRRSRRWTAPASTLRRAFLALRQNSSISQLRTTGSTLVKL